MIYPRYDCKVSFYRGRKELMTYYLYGTLGQLDHHIHKIKRDLQAGWYIIQKLEVATSLLDYPTKKGGEQ